MIEARDICNSYGTWNVVYKGDNKVVFTVYGGKFFGECDICTFDLNTFHIRGNGWTDNLFDYTHNGAMDPYRGLCNAFYDAGETIDEDDYTSLAKLRNDIIPLFLEKIEEYNVIDEFKEFLNVSVFKIYGKYTVRCVELLNFYYRDLKKEYPNKRFPKRKSGYNYMAEDILQEHNY